MSQSDRDTAVVSLSDDDDRDYSAASAALKPPQQSAVQPQTFAFVGNNTGHGTPYSLHVILSDSRHSSWPVSGIGH